MNKPIVAMVGVDKVGKTTIARRVAQELRFDFDHFPTGMLRDVRRIAKTSDFTPDGLGSITFPTSGQTRMLSHALCHALSYDWYRSIVNEESFRGVVWDRYWYCAYAYNKAILGEETPDFRTLMEVESVFNRPLIPTCVIHVVAPEPFGELETTSDREALQREDNGLRERIVGCYNELLSGLDVPSTILRNSPGRMEETVEEAISFCRKHIGALHV